MRKQRSRWVTALALVAILAGPVASVQAAGGTPAEPSFWQLSASLRSWVESILPWKVLTAADCDKGPAVDPNGGCHTAVAVIEAACDKGPLIDPDGQCLAAARPAGGGR